MSKLQYSQNSWQSKVPEKDVRKFTVEGKMQQMPAKNQCDEIKMPKKRSISNDFEQNARNKSDDVNDNSIHTTLSPNNIISEEANEIEKSPIDLQREEVLQETRFDLRKHLNRSTLKLVLRYNDIPQIEIASVVKILAMMKRMMNIQKMTLRLKRS